MNNLPPTMGVPTPPTTRTLAEGSGFTVTCECKWLRFYTNRADASQGEQAHLAKCKGPAVKAAPAAPKARAKTDWTGREGSTWIDKL